MTTKTKAVPTGIDALVGAKARPATEPYLVIEDVRSGWTWKVLKRYGKAEKDFARWFLATSSPHTYGGDELGDGYVRDVVLYGSLTKVDGREPSGDDVAAYAALRLFHRDRPDPMAALGF